MTLRELKELVASEPPENERLEVEIWLPGSSIRLTHAGTMIRRGDKLMIEGNVNPGSALDG